MRQVEVFIFLNIKNTTPFFKDVKNNGAWLFLMLK